MLRKSAIAVCTLVSLGAAALVPTTASAAPFTAWHGGIGLGLGIGSTLMLSGVPYYNCWRWVRTPLGFWSKTNVCY